MEDEKQIVFTEEEIQDLMRLQQQMEEADKAWEKLPPEVQQRAEKAADEFMRLATNNGRIR